MNFNEVENRIISWIKRDENEIRSVFKRAKENEKKWQRENAVSDTTHQRKAYDDEKKKKWIVN